MFIPLEPVAKGRPRFVTHGKKTWAITPDKTRTAEKELKRFVADRLELLGKKELFPLDGAIEVRLSFYLRRPKSVKRIYPTSKPDVDNFAKLILDTLNGLLWLDDSQVVKLSICKLYAESEDKIGINLELEQLCSAEDNIIKKAKK